MSSNNVAPASADSGIVHSQEHLQKLWMSMLSDKVIKGKSAQYPNDDYQLVNMLVRALFVKFDEVMSDACKLRNENEQLKTEVGKLKREIECSDYELLRTTFISYRESVQNYKNAIDEFMRNVHDKNMQRESFKRMTQAWSEASKIAPDTSHFSNGMSNSSLPDSLDITVIPNTVCHDKDVMSAMSKVKISVPDSMECAAEPSHAKLSNNTMLARKAGLEYHDREVMSRISNHDNSSKKVVLVSRSYSKIQADAVNKTSHSTKIEENATFQPELDETIIEGSPSLLDLAPKMQVHVFRQSGAKLVISDARKRLCDEGTKTAKLKETTIGKTHKRKTVMDSPKKLNSPFVSSPGKVLQHCKADASKRAQRLFSVAKSPIKRIAHSTADPSHVAEDIFIEDDDDMSPMKPVPQTPPRKKSLSLQRKMNTTLQFVDDFDRIPSKKTTSPEFQHRTEVVRKREERMKLPGHECDQCQNYYAMAGEADDASSIINKCSRHRAKYNYKPDSPNASYWDPDCPESLVCPTFKGSL